MKKAVMIIGAAVLLTACDSGETKNNEDAADKVGMPNPAATYCVEVKDGKLDVRTGDSGEVSVCILPDGTEIEEWELYRQDHPQADGEDGAKEGQE